MTESLSPTHSDLEIAMYKASFTKAVKKRRFSIVRERLAPRIIPPVMVGGTFAVTLLLDAWQYLPPHGRMIGVMGFIGASVLSPFLHKKTPSPFVSVKDAINDIDRQLDERERRPAYNFNQAMYSKGSQRLGDAYKTRLWETYGKKMEDLPRQWGLKSYYQGKTARTALHASIIGAAVLSGVFNGSTLRQNWETAMTWSSPPPPVPPLIYRATIVPPPSIEGVMPYNDHMIKGAIQTGQTLTPHEESVLTVETYDRPGTVRITYEEDANIQTLTLTPTPSEGGDNEDLIKYTYSTELPLNIISIQIENNILNLDMDEDAAPRIIIHGASPDLTSPEHLRLEYEFRDDIGVTGAEGQLGLTDKDGKFIKPVLPETELPTITLPYE